PLPPGTRRRRPASRPGVETAPPQRCQVLEPWAGIRCVPLLAGAKRAVMVQARHCLPPTDRHFLTASSAARAVAPLGSPQAVAHEQSKPQALFASSRTAGRESPLAFHRTAGSVRVTDPPPADRSSLDRTRG